MHSSTRLVEPFCVVAIALLCDLCSLARLADRPRCWSLSSAGMGLVSLLLAALAIAAALLPTGLGLLLTAWGVLTAVALGLCQAADRLRLMALGLLLAALCNGVWERGRLGLSKAGLASSGSGV